MRTATPPIPVALLGFSDFERQALQSYMQRPARAMAMAYGQVLGVDDARFVVADADQPGTLALLEELDRVADTVFVGAHAPPEAGAWLMRPLTPALVLRALDELQRLRDNPDSLPLPLGLPHSAHRSGFGALDAFAGTGGLAGQGGASGRPLSAGPVVRAELTSGLTPPPARIRGRRQGEHVRPDALPSDFMPLSLPSGLGELPPLVPARALVVDDSEIALHYLQRRLLPYGLTVDLARTPSQALAQLAQHAYGVVFLDLDLGSGSADDGLKLCHRVRHQLHHPDGRVPMVVMVSAFQDPVDQVRGTLAGAEAYMGKPLDLQQLDLLLGRLGFRADKAAARRQTQAEPGARRQTPPR